MADMCREITRSPSSSRTYEHGFCLGQFSLVERLIGSGRSISDPPYPAFSKVCFTPADLLGNRNRIETLIVTFVRYVDTLPSNRRQEGFLNIAIESLERAFPCTESPIKTEEALSQRLLRYDWASPDAPELAGACRSIGLLANIDTCFRSTRQDRV